MVSVYSFLGGSSGNWRVTRQGAYRGAGLGMVSHVKVVEGKPPLETGASWVLEGVVSNVRYATAAELKALAAKQEGLGRPEAKCAALIPIKKSQRWWVLAQDERRKIFEETSRHNAIGMEFLPAIARRLHHCRDLGGEFDFLTWFEYAPNHADAFEELVAQLRKSPEWEYVEREVDLRLERI